MKIYKNWLVSMVLLLITGSIAWAQPKFTIESVSGNQDDVVAVEIRVDDFDDIIGFFIPLRWDATALNYVSHENVNTGLSQVGIATPPGLAEGNLNINWFSANNPVTIENGSLFITVNFRLIGAPGTSSEVNFNDPDRIEAYNSTEPTTNNIGMEITPGIIQILGSGGGDLRLIMDSQTVENGEVFCLKLRVQDFEDVRALQYNLDWDPSVIQFTEIRNFNLPGLDLGDFNINDAGSGSLIMAWIANSTTGESLPDNSAIFELCFEAIGSGGSSTGITFTDVVTEPTASVTNGTVSVQGGLEGFAVIAGDGSGLIDGLQCLDVTVNDFNNINTFQFSLNWDQTKLGLSEISNVHPAIASAYDATTANAGQFAILWFSTQAISIPNGDVLFTLCINTVDVDCDDVNIVEFSEIPTAILFSTTSGVIPPEDRTLDNGTLTTNCGPSITCDDETIDRVTCNGDQGSIFVTVEPADGTYTYTWNDQASQSEDLIDVDPGTYTLVVTETSTNLTATKEVVITEPDAIVIDASSMDPSAAGNDGVITVNSVIGGTGTLTCLWNPDIAQDCSGADNLTANTYVLTVVDENECSATQVFVLENAEFNFTTSVSDAECASENGDCNGMIEVSISGGSGDFTYFLDGEEFDGSVNDLCAGDYVIDVTDNGLNETKSETVVITEPDPITYTTNVTQPSQGTSMDGEIFISNISGGTGPYDIVWPGTSLDTLSNLGSGLYPLSIIDDNGCMIQEMIELLGDLDKCFEGIPAMTPNSDGKNDFLTITCLNNFANSINIYNRWGQRVYNAENYDDSWNGTDLGGNNLEDGVYYWILLVTQPDDSVREVKGYVNLLRNLR